MKKILMIALFAALVGVAKADSRPVIVTVNGGLAGASAYSDQIPISGWLDRVEIIKSDDNDVVDIDLATFSGTTLVESFVDLNAVPTATDKIVLRPRVTGTDIAGNALAASGLIVAGEITNVVNGVVATLPYERMMLGGNLKLKVTAGAGTNATVQATIFFEPTKK